MTRRAFMLLVDPEAKPDDAWVVTCEHCGEDLSRDYMPAPITLSVPSDWSNAQKDEFAKRLQAFELGRNLTRAVMFDRGVEHEVLQELVLQNVVYQHARECAGLSAVSDNVDSVESRKPVPEDGG